MSVSYAEKLKDPRWQKKRLEIFQRDNFTCRTCGEDTKELHVHHLRYAYGAEPWDYPERALVTLCKDCHQEETDGRRIVETELLDALRYALFSVSDIEKIIGVVRNNADLHAILAEAKMVSYNRNPLSEQERLEGV